MAGEPTVEQLADQLRDTRELLGYVRRDLATAREERDELRTALLENKRELDEMHSSFLDDGSRQHDAATRAISDHAARVRRLTALVRDLGAELARYEDRSTEPGLRLEGFALLARASQVPDPPCEPLSDEARDALERGDGVEDRDEKHHCWCMHDRMNRGRPYYFCSGSGDGWDIGADPGPCGQCGGTGWCH